MNKNSLRSSFSKSLMLWFKKEKRKLPFRKTKDPYKVWLSEIILQQTQMETGIKYYKKFIANFPNINFLAEAKEEDVYSLWQGLGYYNRAKNLHKTSKIISKNDGVFPKDYEGLIKLPGIGKYTASAIASICYNEKRYVVDANVYRVFSRLFGIKTEIDKPQAYTKFLNTTSSLAKKIKNTGDYNEAIMDFGGSICLPRKPKCTDCIFKLDCFANKNNLVEALPTKKPRLKIKTRYFNYFIFEHKNVFLYQKRINKDIWQNLFEFYLVEEKNSKKALQLIKNKIQKKLPNPEKSNVITQLSHQKINVVFYNFNIDKKEDLNTIKETLNLKKLKKSNIKKFGFPKVVDNYLNSHS